MKLYLVRHAQRDTGIHFDRLMTLGIWQAKNVAPFFKNKKIDLVYCSPQKRARETLKEIKPYLEKNPKIVISTLIRQKQSPEEIGKSAMKAYNLKSDSFEEIEKRIKKFLEKIKKQDKNKTILVVSHKEVTREFFRNLIPEFKKLDNEKISVKSASISFFEFDKDFKIKNYKLNQIKYSQKQIDFIGNCWALMKETYEKNKIKNLDKKLDKINNLTRKKAKKTKNYFEIGLEIIKTPYKEGLISIKDLESKFPKEKSKFDKSLKTRKH